MRHTFARVDPAESALTVRLTDVRGGFRQERRMLGEATIHCSHVKGENPAYIWVPLSKGSRRRRAANGAAADEELSELQVGGLCGVLCAVSGEQGADTTLCPVRLPPACPLPSR